MNLYNDETNKQFVSADGVYKSVLIPHVYVYEKLGLVKIDPDGLENACIKFELTKSGKMLLEFDKL